MNNLTTRTISGIVFLGILLSGIILHPVGFCIVFLFILIGGLFEFYEILLPQVAFLEKLMGYITATILFLLFYTNGLEVISENCFLILTLPVAALFIIELYSGADKPFEIISKILAGIIYIALPFSLFNALAFHEGNYDYHILLSLFIMLWSNDVGAYCFGKMFGKHKLFERISPKKSWEGFYGGIISSLIAAYLLSTFWGKHYDMGLIHWFILAAIVAVFATFGDLVESMLKRSVKIKDSGSLIPGHGGILDRFDGALLAFPCALAYIHIFNLL